METYTFLRELADSWVLLAMVIFYIGAILWALRPGARRMYDEISEIPLRNDDSPKTSCSGTCEDCRAAAQISFLQPEDA
ncbi:MAG: cbb3-type cytochrome c oxidase subunit 3 [Pseudomonadota bacterium]